MDRWMDGWMDGCMDGWIDRYGFVPAIDADILCTHSGTSDSGVSLPR